MIDMYGRRMHKAEKEPRSAMYSLIKTCQRTREWMRGGAVSTNQLSQCHLNESAECGQPDTAWGKTRAKMQGERTRAA
jgi:hypothetical protein